MKPKRNLRFDSVDLIVLGLILAVLVSLGFPAFTPVDQNSSSETVVISSN